MKVKATVFMLIAAAISGMVGESIERGLNSWDEKRMAKKKAEREEEPQDTDESIEELEKLEEENP